MARWASPTPIPAHGSASLRPPRHRDAVAAKLDAKINAIMKEPEAQQKLKAIGFDVMIKTEAEAADYFKREVASWGKMTRAIGYSSD